VALKIGGFAAKIGLQMIKGTNMFAYCMATAKTGSFYLTETIELPPGTPAGTRLGGSLDLGAYVNVATGQAIAIDQVDFVFQTGSDYGSDAKAMVSIDGSLTVQLTDLNPGSQFVRADNQSLIASGALNIDQTNNIATHISDLYPDNFGPTALSEAFMVVNDTLYLTVKLASKDWMAIAIQSTASDN
jgi:hypothetical protein